MSAIDKRYMTSTLPLLMLLSIVGSAGVSAGERNGTALEDCASIAEDASRLACFDTYIRATRNEDKGSDELATDSMSAAKSAQSEAVGKPAATTESQDKDSASKTETSSESGNRKEPVTAIEPMHSGEAEEPAGSASTVKKASSVSAATASAPSDPDPGNDRPARESASAAAATVGPASPGTVARVETFTRLPRSRLIRIKLDNGQVWQEIDGARFRGSVEPGAEVTITPRRFSGYKMAVPDRAAPIYVRRIK